MHNHACPQAGRLAARIDAQALTLIEGGKHASLHGSDQSGARYAGGQMTRAGAYCSNGLPPRELATPDRLTGGGSGPRGQTQRHRTSNSAPASSHNAIVTTDRVGASPAAAWFELKGGGEPRNEREARYLTFLRQAVQGRSEFEEIPPNLSSAFDGWVPLTIGLEVLLLTSDRRFLWASYWTRADGRQQLQGAWGDDHLMDDWTGDLEDDLTVAGVDASPEQFADWTAAWFARQLSRPVYREEWSRPRTYSVWRFGDTQAVLQSRRPLLAPRREPERVIQER